MGSVSFTYTIGGGEPLGSPFYLSGIQNWSGAFTVHFELSTTAPGIVNLVYNLFRAGDSTTCFTDGTSIFAGAHDNAEAWIVGNPPLAWHCTNWDTFSIGYHSATNRIPMGTTLTVTFDGVGITTAPGICAYGTEPIDPDVSVIDRIGTAISIIRLNPGSLWMWGLGAASLTQPIVVSQLCASPPPPDVDLNPGDFNSFLPPLHYTEAHRKVFVKMQRLLWEKYCRCKAATGGGPPPTGPGPTNITQPTWYITNTYNEISNYDIAYTLNWMWNFQISNQYAYNNTWQIGGDTSTTVDNTSTTVNNLAAATTCPPAAYAEGTVHSSLSGAGRIAIDQVVGFKLEVLEHDTSKPVLTGDPPYLWDVGWVSILGIGDELIEEKRLTREAYLWFPCAIMHATEFGYRLREASVCRVTELVVPGGGLEPP